MQRRVPGDPVSPPRCPDNLRAVLFDPPLWPKGGNVSASSVGVLALQGDVAEHLRAIESVGAGPVPVRRRSELASVDGLIIPGGESTTIWKLLSIFELAQPLRARIAEGMPVFGSCAGMILLADQLVERASEQEALGGIDMTVRRNAFGRQVDSFESDIDITGVAGQPFRAVFIRAPWVEKSAPGFRFWPPSQPQVRSSPSVRVRRSPPRFIPSSPRTIACTDSLSTW